MKQKMHPVLHQMLQKGVHPHVVHQMHMHASNKAQQVFQQALAHRMASRASGAMKHAGRGR